MQKTNRSKSKVDIKAGEQSEKPAYLSWGMVEEIKHSCRCCHETQESTPGPLRTLTTENPPPVAVSLH
jgi:hypothetical protein